jgi:hypothetical protein
MLILVFIISYPRLIFYPSIQILCYRLSLLHDCIRGSVFIKKITKPNFFKKKQNRFKPTDFGSVFLEQKPVQPSLARFFGFSSVFFYLAWFFSVWIRFGFGSVFSGL